MSTTTVYRAYGSSGRLLYIGVAADPGSRWSTHRYKAPWWPDVARIDLEHLKDRKAALEAEKAAIISERPIHNLVHNRGTDRVLTSWSDDVQDLLRTESRPRARIMDDLTYRIPGIEYRDARPYQTCRLQLFAAPGYRAVAVATQVPGEGSLVNWAENVAADVWRRHCPWSYVPPIWIENMIECGVKRNPDLVMFDLDEYGSASHNPLGDDGLGTCQECRTGECKEADEFDAYSLAYPEWLPITPEDLNQLVGCEVDLTRGSFSSI